MDRLRERKKWGYGGIPIETDDPRSRDGLVNVHELDIAGQNYYSRPNATISEPIPGVPEAPMLRRPVAETLSRINLSLRNLAVTAFFGAEVELYVEDGLRTTELQRRLFEVEVPNLLLRNDPLLTYYEVEDRRSQIIAAPSADPSRPSPHSTGGAVDVILRYAQPTKTFVENSNVWLGHVDGDTARTIDPDYYEAHPPQNGWDEEALRNRRAFYAIMTGHAFGRETHLAVNPTEIWHWSRGDQLWALASGARAAYYGPVEHVEE